MRYLQKFIVLLFITQWLVACGGSNTEETSQTTPITTDTIASSKPIAKLDETLPPDFYRMRLFEAGKQLVIWAEGKETDTEVKLHILYPATGNVLKKMTIASQALVPQIRIENRLYAYDGKSAQLEARDLLTGELTLNNNLLEKRFKTQLGEGIGKAHIFAPKKWISITTKRGKAYTYSPVYDTLIGSKQASTYFGSIPETKKAAWVTQWRMAAKPDNNHEAKYIMTKVYWAPGKRRIYHGKQVKESKLKTLVAQGKIQLVAPTEKSKYFLNIRLVHFGKSHVLFVYETEVGPQAKKILTCQNDKGEVVWEKALASNKTLKDFVRNTRRTTFVDDPEKENMLAIAKYNKAIGLDLNTGKIVWKYGDFE